jgi:hypothetical protein
MAIQRKWLLRLGIGLLIGITIASCGASHAAPLASVVTVAPPAGQAADYSDKSVAQSGVVDNLKDLQSASPAQDQSTQNRVVLKNATLAITVKDPASTIDAISKIASDQGGWIVSSNAYQQTSSTGAQQTYGSITIRVPSDKLDSILNQIRAAALSVDNVNVTGEDVTDQYTDLNSQLTNLQSAQVQLQKIMDSATKTEDVLAVFNQMTSINGQIEVIKGKLKFFDQSAAYSSIAVTLSPSADSKPLAIGGWQPSGTVKDAVQTLVQILQGLVDIAIWLIIVVLPFAIVAFLAYRVYRRFRPRRVQPKSEPTPETPATEA